jgi:serine/threonine protein kinase
MLSSNNLVIDFEKITFQEQIHPHYATGEQDCEVFLGKLYGTQTVCIKKFKRKEKLDDRKLFREAQQLHGLLNPNIVLCMGISLTDQYIYQISEYMQEGSVFEQLHIKKKITINNLSGILDLLDKVAKGMSFLHGHKMIHGNLNTKSILIDEDWNYKISEFGFPKLRERCHRLKKSKVATQESPYWLAPEIFKGERFGMSSDVYSFGILLW